jgi:hypothetical protein
MNEQHASHLGCNLFEHSDAITSDRWREIRNTSHVSTRTGKVSNEPSADRVGHLHEDRRYRARLLKHSLYPCGTLHENDIGCGSHKFRGRPASVITSPADINLEISANRPSELL